ncbi:MAG: glycosyltransferase family 39 protein [Candidatus Thiodiazotropha sp.]
MKWNKSITTYYMLGLFLIGLSYIAIVPVFEGFDETAHYSSLREVAINSSIPMSGSSFFDLSITNYRGPVSYSTGVPPFDQGYVYPKFFSDIEAANNYVKDYRTEPVTSEFYYSDTPNWQAQHPPLYYMLLAPILKLSGDFSLYDQVIVLRTTSYLLALVGVFFGMIGASAIFKSEGFAHLLGYAVYPILLPMFFLEFARIGNDSLCLFLSGLSFYVLSLCIRNEFAIKYLILLGFVLGLGMLTKAFFIPILAGTSIYIAARIFAEKESDRSLNKSIAAGITVFISAILIGGGWYVYKFLAFGAISGSDEAIKLASSGGLIQGVIDHFDFIALLRGISVWLPTYQWAGTWSLTRLPIYFQLPSLLLLMALILNVFVCVRQRPFLNPLWLSVIIFALFIAGLIWHVFVSMAIGGVPTSPGWYLHILMPWVAPALGVSLLRFIVKRGAARNLTIMLLALTFVYQLISTWSLISLYSACAIKSPTKNFFFQSDWYCLSDLSVMVERLSVIASPFLFLITFLVGYAIYGIAIKKMTSQLFYEISAGKIRAL